MKRIILHLAAFVAMLPLAAVFSEGNVIVNILGLLYFAWLFIWLNDNPTGRKLLRAYYREILRIEREMAL